MASSTAAPVDRGSESAQCQSLLLATDHVVIFTRLGIGRDLLAAAGVRSVSDQEAREQGFQLFSGSDLSGIVFPYNDPETGRRVTARLRRDHPDTDAAGKVKCKYVCAYRDNPHLYFPPGTGTLLADTATPVVLVEAEKSALAITALAARAGRKLLVVATGGCWGWRGKVGIEPGPRGGLQQVRGPVPDLRRINWSGRVVIILFDANSQTNLQVRAARRALAEELEARVASVRIANLPQVGGVNGPDDLIVESGDGAMWALLEAAQPFAETAEREAEAAVAALEADKNQDPTMAVEAIAAVTAPLRWKLLAGRVAVLKIPGLTKGVVEEEVERGRRRVREKQVNAMEAARRERLLSLTVNPAKLIADLESYYSRRRHLPAGAAFVEALFCLNTYVFDVFDTTPYLLYESVTSGCGKTTSLEYHETVCARAYLGVDPSAAAVYRKIDRDRPTWLLDEAALLETHGDRARELLAIFDAGYKRGATVSRCTEHGEELRDFSVYCPKVLSRIGGFRGTLLDRGIVMHLEKARLRKARRKVLLRYATPLKEALEAYALQYRTELEQLYENEPDDGYWSAISGREEEVWGPLLTHARLAGSEIEARALPVALQFSREKAEIALTEDRNLALAQEVLEVLEALGSETFSPGELVAKLSVKETWGADLAGRKSDKARDSAVGKFFSHFRLSSRNHTATGTRYNRVQAIEVLGRHTPDVRLPAERVNVSDDATTTVESTDLAADTSQEEVSAEVSFRQPVEGTADGAQADTLTPYSARMPEYEEEL